MSVALPKGPSDTQSCGHTLHPADHVQGAPGLCSGAVLTLKLHRTQFKQSQDNLIPFQFPQTMGIHVLQNRSVTGLTPVLCLCPNSACLYPRRLEAGELEMIKEEKGPQRREKKNKSVHLSISQSVSQFSRSVVSNSLRPHESQHARPPCPSPTPRVHPDSRPSSQ